VEVAAAAWFIFGVVLTSIEGRLFPHYVIPLAVPLAILANDGLLRPSGRAAGMVVALGVVVLATAGAFSAYRFDHRGPPTERVSDWIVATVPSDSTILDWGVDANVYLASGRAPAGRYPYLLPLVTNEYVTEAVIKAWVDDLALAPPAVIIDSEAANPYWTEDQDFLRPPPPGAAGGRTADLLDPFRRWVRQNYRLAAEIDGRKIYRLVLSTDPNRHG
jgi:hypothetical protein